MKMSQRIDSDTFKITMENYQWKALIGAQLSLKFQHLKIFQLNAIVVQLMINTRYNAMNVAMQEEKEIL